MPINTGGLVQSATNFINRQLGFETTFSEGGEVYLLPWEATGSEDAFFPYIDIQGYRWDKLYPYRLLVIDAEEKTIISGLDSGSISSLNVNKKAKSSTGISYILSQEPINSNWVFNFPITPQQFSVTDQFAINTSATMRGIVEEHNGVKFKTITMSGTTGLWPHRPTIAGNIKSPGILGGLAGGTLEAARGVFEQVSNVAKSFTGEKGKGNAQRPENSENNLSSTGYFYAMFLGQFLERYAQEKKNPKNKNWRLVLDIPKENQSFVVTPIQFTLQKSQQRPNEYQWAIQLKAWKRISLDEQPDPAPSEPIDLGTPNILSRITGTIRDVRRLIASNINLLKAVRSDFQRHLNILRQTSLAIKDLGGLAFTLIDLPGTILRDIESAIDESFFNLRTAFKRSDEVRSQFGQAGLVGSSRFRTSNQETKAGKVINAIFNRRTLHEGLNKSLVQSGALGVEAAQLQQIDPINEVFNNPEEYFDLFDAIPISTLKLTPEQQTVIEEEIEEVRLLTQEDLVEFKQEIQTLALDISDSFGAEDQTFARIYGRSEPKQRTVPMSVEENEILVALFEMVQVYDYLTSTKLFDDNKAQNSLEYVSGVANDAGIDFQDFTSKFLVPVPFGLTIEQIAARYLGNADRWIEIVTVNNLREPYIDEEGFQYTFLSNASGRQFNGDDSENRLFIGQRIIIQSNTVKVFARKIIDIERISDTNFIVTVDGDANLDNLTTSQNARMRGYLPGTTNSQNQIFIPSNLAAEIDDRIKIPAAFQNDRLAKISKIDWLLTDNFDIAINNLGDFRLSSGLNNLVQALKLKIRTRKGSLLRHLDYGLGIRAGVSIADIEGGELLGELTRLVISDPRFSGIERLDIILDGPTLKIDLSIIVANNSGIIPISFDL